MQRAAVVGGVLFAGLAVAIAVSLNGSGESPQAVETGETRVPLERTEAPDEAVPEPAEPEPVAPEPAEDVDGDVVVAETTPLPAAAEVVAPAPRDLTRISVTVVAGSGSTVVSVLEQIGKDEGFQIVWAAGTRERLEGTSLTVNLQETSLEDALKFIGMIGKVQLEIRDGGVHASDL